MNGDMYAIDKLLEKEKPHSMGTKKYIHDAHKT